MAKCERYYTLDHDGLSQPWFGRVWCNPPYSRIKPWIDRANQGDADRVVMLVPASTDTTWWRAANAEHVFIPGRLRFGSCDRAPFGSALLVWSRDRVPRYCHRCDVCNGLMFSYRSDRRTCSASCRQRLSRLGTPCV